MESGVIRGYIIEEPVYTAGLPNSIVYRARNGSGRHVAVKKTAFDLMRTFMFNMGGVEREARIHRELDHPRVVRALDDFREDGWLYLVMEYAEGGSLDDRIGDEERSTLNGINQEEAALIAADVASGLGYLHTRGWVHIDIKPSNVLFDREDRALVCDFALAREIGGFPSDALGLVCGTAPYMSPEQAKGECVDGRSDVFSLGTMLYKMLTGRLLFNGLTAREVMESVIGSEPRAPSSIVAVDGELERICLRALEKDRDRRYPRAEDMEGELRDAAERIGKRGIIPVGIGVDCR